MGGHVGAWARGRLSALVGAWVRGHVGERVGGGPRTAHAPTAALLMTSCRVAKSRICNGGYRARSARARGCWEGVGGAQLAPPTLRTREHFWSESSYAAKATGERLMSSTLRAETTSRLNRCFVARGCGQG